MYRVTVSATFSAKHHLRLPSGRLEPLHGHDWQVEVRFAGRMLDSYGLLIDFDEAQQALRTILGQLHQTVLNDCGLMRGLSPSAEHVARVIWDCLADRVDRPDLLESVEVTEAPGCRAAYFRPPGGTESRQPSSVDDEKPDS